LAEEASKEASLLPLLQVTLEELWAGGFGRLELIITKVRQPGPAQQQRADAVYDYSDYDGRSSSRA